MESTIFDFEKQSRNLNSPEQEIAGSPTITVNLLPDFSRMDISTPLETTFSNVSSPSKKN